MKIAVLTYSHESNCGAVLQSWAMKQVLEGWGHDVDFPIINGFTNKGRIYDILRTARFGPWRFVKNIVYQFCTLGIKEWLDSRFASTINKLFPLKVLDASSLVEYDLIVVGSDQVWNPLMGEHKMALYLGEAIPSTIPLVAYAVSSGDSVPAERWGGRVATAVRRFVEVFVREDSTRNYIQRVSGVKCRKVLDPSLLQSFDSYHDIEEGEVPDEPFVFFYVFAGKEVKRIVKEILKATGVNCAVFYDGCCDFIPRKRPRQYRRFISPGEFVRLTRRAVAVVACSFHGTAFAMSSGKPFISLTTKGKAFKFETRSGDLVRQFGCADRLFSIEEPISDMCCAIKKPVDSAISVLLQKSREKSLSLLKSAIVTAEQRAVTSRR